MTNEQIIFNAAVELMNAGAIKSTGRTIECVNGAGETISIDEPEAIHTFQDWKARGYCVRKGEHAIARLLIWKPCKTAAAKAAEEEAAAAGMILINKPKMMKVTAAFFSASQVDAIKAC